LSFFAGPPGTRGCARIQGVAGAFGGTVLFAPRGGKSGGTPPGNGNRADGGSSAARGAPPVLEIPLANATHRAAPRGPVGRPCTPTHDRASWEHVAVSPFEEQSSPSRVCGAVSGPEFCLLASPPSSLHRLSSPGGEPRGEGRRIGLGGHAGSAARRVAPGRLRPGRLECGRRRG
jgi:hypothetical protein